MPDPINLNERIDRLRRERLAQPTHQAEYDQHLDRYYRGSLSEDPVFQQDYGEPPMDRSTVMGILMVYFVGMLVGFGIGIML